jgi:NACalpha-BTF3-like transcription factor
MASPSIGDVLTIIELVYGVYKKCKDAPEAVQDAMKDVILMRTELQSMQEKVNNKNSFIHKNRGQMLARVEETFEPIIKDLEKLKSLLVEFRRTPLYSGRYLYYVYYKVPQVKNIQASFKDARAVYSTAFQHIGAEADAATLIQLEAMSANYAQLEKSFKNMVRKQQTEAVRQQKEDNEKIMEQLLANEEKLNNALKTKNNDLQVEAQLRALGLKDEEVKRIVAALKFDAISPVKVTPSQNTGNKKPGNEKNTAPTKQTKGDLQIPHRPRSASQPRKPAPITSPAEPGPKKRAPSPALSQTKSVPTRSTSPNPPIRTDNLRVLCIDGTNGRTYPRQPFLALLTNSNQSALYKPKHISYSSVSGPPIHAHHREASGSSPVSTPQASILPLPAKTVKPRSKTLSVP